MSTFIPGPKKPKDLNSFLRPLVDELTALETGQPGVIDGDDGQEFVLRAHVLIVTGDGPAVADAMGMKSPGNAYRPCRMCKIPGERRYGARHSPYYVPHTTFAFDNPPMRTDLREDIRLVEEAGDDKTRMLTGIRGSTELLRLQSIHFPRSFPGDIMHCVLQNITPCLFQLWNRTKLAIDDTNPSQPTRCTDRSGMPSYYLATSDLNSIGDALSRSHSTIPTSLGHAPRRIDNHYKGFKAAEWKAWLIHYGPPLLWKHLHERYLANFRILGQFYKLSTAPLISRDSVQKIAALARQFVGSYEELYYRNEQERLPVCTINIHSILHYADWIRDCGPACYFWQFPMERFCGIIKPTGRSKSRLNASIANKMVIMEHFNHLCFVHEDYAAPKRAVPDCASYPQLANKANIDLTHSQIMRLLARSSEIDSVQPYKRCHLNQGTTIGSRLSQIRNDLNREDFRIVYRDQRGTRKFGAVEFFATVTNSDTSSFWAYIQTLTGEVVRKRERVIAVQHEGRHIWIQVEQIDGLIGLLQEGRGRFFMIISDSDLF
jgi:Transposase family tnp2